MSSPPSAPTPDPEVDPASPAPEKRRTKLTWAQLVRLEGIFALSWYPSWAEKDALAREFDLEHQQINVWFCNRRTKAKREKEQMPDSFIPSHAQAALKSKRAVRKLPQSPDAQDDLPTTMAREPTPDLPLSSRASSTAPDPRPIALPPIRTSPPHDDDRKAPAPATVSASSAASIQAQLSSSLSAALLGSASSSAYRAPYVSRPQSRDRSLSPTRTHQPRHRSNSAGSVRHSPYASRQHTYPFTHPPRSNSGSPPPGTLAPIGRPDYPQSLPPFHKATQHAGFPSALPAPPTTKPHDQYQHRYATGDYPGPTYARSPLLAHRLTESQASSPASISPTEPDHRKGMLPQPIQAPPHVGALQAAPHVGAFHSMPVVGVFQGTAPPPTELPISVWQAHPLVRTRARITRDQLRALEALFSKTWFPTSQQRAEAANATGMREYSVTVWFQNRRSKAKKEGITPPEGDRSKLRKDKGPKRDLGTHVFEVGSSRHPEPMGPSSSGTTFAPTTVPSAPSTQNLVWLEDARSRGRAPVMKTNNGTHHETTENPPDHSRSPHSWSDAEAEAESDVEMESEAESRARKSAQAQPQYQLRDDARSPPSYGRAYTHHTPRESQAQTLYPPREAHPSYAKAQDQAAPAETAAAPRMRRRSSSSSQRSTPSSQHVSSAPNATSKTHSSYPLRESQPRRRNSDHSHQGSEEDALESARDPESESEDRPAKRSRRENEHTREDGEGRHRADPEKELATG